MVGKGIDSFHLEDLHNLSNGRWYCVILEEHYYCYSRSQGFHPSETSSKVHRLRMSV